MTHAPDTSTSPRAARPEAQQEAVTGWEITQHLQRFFRDFDAWRYDLMADAFVAEGSWDRNGLVLRGRDAIVAELSRRPATAAVRHVVTNVVVTPSGPDAAGLSFYVTAYRYDDGTELSGTPVIRAPYLLLAGEASLLRDGDGWRFSHQRLTRLFEFENPGGHRPRP